MVDEDIPAWDIPTGDLVWSDEVYRIFGVEQDAFPATCAAFIRAVHPDDRARVQQAVDRAHRPGSPPYSTDFRVVHPDGSVRITHAAGEVTFDEGSFTHLGRASRGHPVRRARQDHEIEASGAPAPPDPTPVQVETST